MAKTRRVGSTGSNRAVYLQSTYGGDLVLGFSSDRLPFLTSRRLKSRLWR
ncbi:predicted protein [Botrytis cinerea T4]|uniref:Uncharacterized protein n=1 Tax=Botryotinia fuckeliana (strain T4) TaxID=999810 RepID=G2YYP1_BOTF4|nr:predicted protein [Botrytis cinerea T4]